MYRLFSSVCPLSHSANERLPCQYWPQGWLAVCIATHHALMPLSCSAAAVWWRNAVLDLGNLDQVGSVLRTKHNDFSDDSRTMQV
jgi:hypothetical protein